MKRVYRTEANRTYWDRRWSQSVEDADKFEDLTIYPIRYAENVVKQKKGKILEIGCGLGRLVKHYSNLGREVVGIERSKVAVDKIQAKSPNLAVYTGDALKLEFDDNSFEIILAFGVYHNFESGLEMGIREVARILKPEGHFVISMRPQNFEMILNEWYWRWRNKGARGAKKHFHKMVVREKEFRNILQKYGLLTEFVYKARNMSILFRVPFLRSSEIKHASETIRRAKGYKLNWLGRFMDKLLTSLFPGQFCNVLVFEGRRAGS